MKFGVGFAVICDQLSNGTKARLKNLKIGCYLRGVRS